MAQTTTRNEAGSDSSGDRKPPETRVRAVRSRSDGHARRLWDAPPPRSEPGIAAKQETNRMNYPQQQKEQYSATQCRKYVCMN